MITRITLIIVLTLAFLLDVRVDCFKEIPLPLYQFNVDATCYYPDKRQTDNTPFITASNKRINKINPIHHRWIAVSRDLLKTALNMGDTVIVTGTEVYDGEWVVNDEMNKRFRMKIDFLVGSHNTIDRWENILLQVKNK